MTVRQQHFLKLTDYTPEEIGALLDLAAELKADKKAGREKPRLCGKNIALVFEKTSTRTRCAFEVAARDQGAGVTYLEPSGSQIGHTECSTASNTGATDKKSWKNWRVTPACPYSTA